MSDAMNDAQKNHDDAALEAFFDAARADPPMVPQALMARVLADAQAAQPIVGGWRTWLRALGGAPGLGGLVTATCVGVWIGLAPPQQLPDLGGLVLGMDTAVDADTYALGWDIEEG
ncbi:MAG: hypothetical protein WBB25_12020 [Sulfitobacter sp.]